jgi:hypothetical protein
MKMRDIIRLVEAAEIDIVEKRLPLNRGANRIARAEYAAFFCVMDPMDFIRLTTHNQQEIEKIFGDDFASLEDFRANDSERQYRKGDYNPPFLWVYADTGEVHGHEGRHRAAMIARAGGDKFPAMIRLYERDTYVLSYWKLYLDDALEDDEQITQTFSSYEEAEAEAARLKAIDDTEFPYWFSRFDIEVAGRGLLKGAPSRSDAESYTHAAWTNEDMPAQFIGQFDPTVVIPTSRMRYGPVKGYRHHRA